MKSLPALTYGSLSPAAAGCCQAKMARAGSIILFAHGTGPCLASILEPIIRRVAFVQNQKRRLLRTSAHFRAVTEGAGVVDVTASDLSRPTTFDGTAHSAECHAKGTSATSFPVVPSFNFPVPVLAQVVSTGGESGEARESTIHRGWSRCHDSRGGECNYWACRTP